MTVVLTRGEEAKYSFLVEGGYDDLAELYRSCTVRDHETFEMLSKADLTALYGPGVSEEWVGRIRHTLSEGDHTLVRAMHEYLLTLKKKHEEATEANRKEFSASSVPVGLVIFGVSIAVLSVIGFAVAIFMGS